MSLDLTALTPAPWTASRMSCQTDRNTYTHEVALSDGHEVILLRKADAEFIALARNAFDIQMRRGWTACRKEDGLWIVYAGDTMEPIAGSRWPDPVTALVKCEEWYVANVEGT